MPRWVTPTLLLMGVLGLVPFACVARARVTRTDLPRVHLVQDMDNQPHLKAQQANKMYADGRAMRLPVEGTVARGKLDDDTHFHYGLVGESYATTFPRPLTAQIVLRGRERFEIFCSPCHGLSGHGDGMVSRRADQLQQGTWVPPASLHDEPAYSRSVGHLFNSITNGIRNMPAYGNQIPPEDRWAIVSYVRALQRSQHADPEDVPPSERAGLNR